MWEDLISFGHTRALVDDFGEIIYVGTIRFEPGTCCLGFDRLKIDDSCTLIVAFVCSSFYQGMMMFIFGWGNRPMLVQRGVFPCPVCKTTTDSIHLRHRRWITFFFVPAIPISSSYETVACQKCKSSFPTEAIRGETPSKPISTRVPLSATVAMIGSMSFGLALVSVILGHTALKEIKRDRPAFEGRRRAIIALAVGYPAILLSLVVGFNAMTHKKSSSSDLYESGVEQEENFDTKDFGISDSINDSFKNAGYEIASKRDKPPGRGNNPEAIELANTFASRMKDVYEEAFTSNRKPLLQLSDGEFLTYCQLHEDRCLFLVHVPSYRNYNKVAKKTLAEFAWIVAQSTTAGKLKKKAKLGLALRGVLSYGAIMIGEVPSSTEDRLQSSIDGKKEDLVAFFESSNPSTIAQSASSKELDQNPFESMEPTEPLAPVDKPIDVPLRKDPEVSRPPKKKPEEPEFVNQIGVQLIRTFSNESWGTTSLASSPDEEE